MADSSKAMEVDRPTCRALSLPQQQSQQRRGEGADEEPAHNHLILSPTRGEVHAHGRWHKYVKPRIGMGFQAISIPSVGEGAVEAGDGADGAQRVIGSRTSSASSLGELSAAAQSSGQGPGWGGGGEPQLQQQPTRKSGRKTAGKRSGRSTPSTEGHQSNGKFRYGVHSGGMQFRAGYHFASEHMVHTSAFISPLFIFILYPYVPIMALFNPFLSRWRSLLTPGSIVRCRRPRQRR